LIIKKKNKSWLSDWTSGKVTIRIPIEEISSLILSGSGKIKSQKTITSNRFKTVISGSGDIDLEVEATSVEGTLTGSGDLHLSGKTERVEFQITGSGDITAQDLKAQTGQAQIAGSGDIEMHATETLNGSITGSGDLLCYGSPERQVTKVTGSGDITIRH
jgi:polyisoprenoid-binding protein YceI